MILDAKSHNQIGHEDFGVIASFINLILILATIVDFGLAQYCTKRIAAKPSDQNAIYPIIFHYKLSMLLLFPLALLLFGMAVGHDTQELYYLVLLGFAQALTQLLFFFRATFQGNQQFLIDSTASVLDKFLIIGILFFLLQTGQMTMENYVYARVVSFGFSVVAYYAVSLKLFGLIRPKFEFNQMTDLVRASIPFGLITILYTINERLDQYMIFTLSPDKANAGHYAGGYRFLDAIMMYLWTILPIFFAKFAHHLEEHSAKQRLFNVGQIIASVPMTFVCVSVFFYGEKLFPLLLDKSSASDLATMSVILKVLFISAFVHGVFGIYHTLLTSTGYELKVALMVVASIVINIVLNYFAIPRYGAIGSAWVTLVSTVFLSLCYLYYIHKYTDILVPYTILLRLGITYVLLIATFYWFNQLISPIGVTIWGGQYDLQWLVVCSISGLALVLYSWFTGLIRILIQKGEL